MMTKITEEPSKYRHLEKMSVEEAKTLREGNPEKYSELSLNTMAQTEDPV
jgi:hypothetical protein